MRFALIGGDVKDSKSPGAHRAVFKALAIDAVYDNISLSPEELGPFFQKRAFDGLSVTMPHKEAIIPLLDALTPEAEAMGAVNTVEVRDGALIGHNTDGQGAIKALEEKTSLGGKTLVLLGAGGAAKAIAFTAKKRGAKLVVLNRTPKRAEALSDAIGRLEDLPSINYDIIVNATPNPLPIDPEHLKKGKLIMDIRNREEKEMPLLTLAREKGAETIHGREMWIQQAVLQHMIWFKGKTDPEKTKDILRKNIR